MRTYDEARDARRLIDLDFTLPTLIMEYLREHSEATFIDLEHGVPGFPGKLTVKTASNRLLWQGVSRFALDALWGLEQQGRIRYEETSPMIYQVQGMTLHSPTARHSQAPQWLPVVVRLKESQAEPPAGCGA